MGITYNNGSLRNVKSLTINPSGTLRNMVAVWRNVNGTIEQVWPDTAYDGSHFAGELRGGVINAPRNLRLYGSTGDTYRWPNEAYWGGATDMGQTITSGALTATKSSPFGDNEGYGPFFVSVGAIDFTKYSKVRIAGSFTASMRAYRSSGDAFMDATIKLREYVKSGDYYNFIASTSEQSTTDITTKSTSWYTGTVSFDFTFDISSWVEKAGVFCLFANNNWFDTNSSTGGEYGSQALRLTRIEFIK
jgi:hypothetical protein